MRSVLLIIAVIAGILLPQAAFLNVIIKFLIMFLLFIAFLDIHLDKSFFNLKVFQGYLVNVLLAIAVYAILLIFDKQLAITAFITVIGPTATAAPAIMLLLKKHVEFTTAAVLLSSIVTGLVLPFMLPFITELNGDGNSFAILANVLMVILIPLIAGQALKHLSHRGYLYMLKHQSVSLYILCLIVFLAVSNSSLYIRTQIEVTASVIVMIAIQTLLICALCFLAGRIVGGKKFAIESAQSLGNKNTILMMWFATTYISPVVALGPVFYLVCDSTYNAYLIYKIKRSKAKKKSKSL